MYTEDYLMDLYTTGDILAGIKALILTILVIGFIYWLANLIKTLKT